MASGPFQPYGTAQYGLNLYGGGFPVPPAITGIYPPTAFSGCPAYQKFAFSGIALPLYVFELNPSTYDPYPARNTQSYKTILDYDPTIDETYKKLEITLQWDWMSSDMWNAILPYSRKLVDGTSEPLFFWDSTIGHFNGTLVKLDSLKGNIPAGYDAICKTNVQLKLREI